MEKTQNGYQFVIGIDVSKLKLDPALGSNGSLETFSNDSQAINDFIQKQVKRPRDTIVVVEATGGYESQLVDMLHQTEIAVAIVNPRRVRDFAKGIGRDAKTDPIDAKVIAYYGEVVKPNPTLPKMLEPKQAVFSFAGKLNRTRP